MRLRLDKEARVTNRAEQLAEHVRKIRAAQPDYESLAAEWRSVIADRMKRFIDSEYADIGITNEQRDKMASRDVDLYRKSLSDEAFKAQLDDLHKLSVEVLIRQLEFERDNPGKEYQEPEPEPKEEESPLIDAFVQWLGTRVAGNITAAQRESGEGAKILRATLGISWTDIQNHGIFGGPNSFFRKPFG